METRVDRPDTDPAAVWVPSPPAGGPATGKEEKRRQKREERLRRDAVRSPDSWERFRILLEVVDQQRNVVEIADHKARYALIILGVLNAIIFVLLGRGGVFRELPDALRPWLVGVIAIYAALTFVFVLHAIDCLRPREIGGKGSVHRAGIPGLLFWEGIVQHDREAYRQEWSTVRMDLLNAEAILVAHRVSQLIQAKYRALHRLYNGLVVLVFTCTLLLVAYAIWGSVP
jgi:hypothetical protein